MFDIECNKLCCGFLQLRNEVKIENSTVTLKVTPQSRYGYQQKSYEPFQLVLAIEKDVINISFSRNDLKFVLPKKSSFEFTQHDITISLENAKGKNELMNPISIKCAESHVDIIPPAVHKCTSRDGTRLF